MPEFLVNYYYKFLKVYWLLRYYIKPVKSPRVYIRKGIGRMRFLEILNKRKVDYVLLRWWENLPEIPEGEDLDILVRDEHRDLMKDLLTFRNNGTGDKCDIYTLTGSNFGSHRGLPYFQSNLGNTLLNTKVLYRGAYVPSPQLYFASLAYHAVFHKGIGSGLPGFYIQSSDAEHEYPTILNKQAKALDLDVDMTVQGIYQWLEERDFSPADDTLTKLVEIKPELAFLQKPLFSDARGGDLIVYVVRERLVKDGLLDDFKTFLEKEFLFDVVDVKMLDAKEKDICASRIRGGKWDEGPYKFSGGEPVALVIAFDPSPSPLNDEESKKQPRMTNSNNLVAKYQYRNRVNGLGFKSSDYNGVHSSDNEQDALFYISLLGDKYSNKILAEVESRREHKKRLQGMFQV